MAPVVIANEGSAPGMKRQIIANLPFRQNLQPNELRAVFPMLREIGCIAGEHIRTSVGGGLFVAGRGTTVAMFGGGLSGARPGSASAVISSRSP